MAIPSLKAMMFPRSMGNGKGLDIPIQITPLPLLNLAQLSILCVQRDARDPWVLLRDRFRKLGQSSECDQVRVAAQA
jgi:hypothetical protein